MTQNFDSTRGYFGDARQVHLPDVYPPFLAREVPRNDGVIACEGSMFKSKFANALTIMIIGSLGIAAAQNKLSVGYGAEAGEMDPFVQSMCRRYCRDSFIITRNPESQEVLGKLGVSTELGTDTAWTFEPHPSRIRPQDAAGSRLGRSVADSGGVPDSSILVAGDGIDRQASGASHRGRLQRKLLPHDLLSSFGRGSGRGL